MVRILSTVFFLSLVSAIMAQTDIVGAIQSGGLTREYRLYQPAAYTGNTAVPLVINMHGYGSNNLEQEFYGDFRGIADTANFLIVHPNGTFDNQGERFWNTFGNGATVDDVGFIRNLIDTLSATWNIDPERIYATGMSNGGFMSYSLACELNERIAAIASVTGSMSPFKLAACSPQHPVPVMEIHGTADNVVPYNGIPLSMSATPDLVNAWVDFNNCNPTPAVSNVPNISTSDNCTAEHYVYSGGDAGSTVEHYKIIGGGHTWPGAFFIIGVTNQDFSASKEIWRFFSQYTLNGVTTSTTVLSTHSEWTAAPNPAGDYLVLYSAAQEPVENIQICNAAGQMQHTLQQPGSTPIRLETADWTPGLYLITIEKSGKRQYLKVIKG
ncbi:MAG: T9SS type A sorting domain-containing protein [Saprospiraceae bacterium]|nr:T9SS type A sorting domain-containing protein [Saprospiraceae bacterium]